MARKIIIHNKTRYQNKHLRAIIVRAVNQVVENQALHPTQKRTLTFEVTYNRQGKDGSGCSGWAHLNGTFARVMLPSGKPDRIDFAHVVAHELGHCLGLSHPDMYGSPIFTRTGSYRERFAWAAQLPLEEKPKKVKAAIAPADYAAKKLTDTQKRIKAWETRLKRAQTALKKYRAKEKYYTKRASVIAAQKPPVPKKLEMSQHKGE